MRVWGRSVSRCRSFTKQNLRGRICGSPGVDGPHVTGGESRRIEFCKMPPINPKPCLHLPHPPLPSSAVRVPGPRVYFLFVLARGGGDTSRETNLVTASCEQLARAGIPCWVRPKRPSPTRDIHKHVHTHGCTHSWQCCHLSCTMSHKIIRCRMKNELV